MSITKETRRESYNTVIPTTKARQDVVLDILSEHGEMSAQEIATELHKRGHTPSDERNFAAPRLTELKEAGKVEAIGKKLCFKTGRKVAVWSIKKDM